MNPYRIGKATKALWDLEAAQDRFNKAVENLSEEDLQTFIKKNDLYLEESKAKLRIKEALEKETVVSEKSEAKE